MPEVHAPAGLNLLGSQPRVRQHVRGPYGIAQQPDPRGALVKGGQVVGVMVVSASIALVSVTKVP